MFDIRDRFIVCYVDLLSSVVRDTIPFSGAITFFTGGLFGIIITFVLNTEPLIEANYFAGFIICGIGLLFVKVSRIYRNIGLSLYFCAVLYLTSSATYTNAVRTSIVASWWSDFVIGLFISSVILYIPGRMLDVAIRAGKEKERRKKRQRRKNKQRSSHSDKNTEQNHSHKSGQSECDRKTRSVTDSEEPIPDSSEIKRSSGSVTDHPMFQDVLTTLTGLGGIATTSQVAESMDISRVGAYDRLRTLEIEGEINLIDDNKDHTWKVVE